MPENSIQYQHVVEDQMELERKNNALTEVLEHIEQQKMQIKDDVIANAEDLLIPMIDQLVAKGSNFTSTGNAHSLRHDSLRRRG